LTYTRLPWRPLQTAPSDSAETNGRAEAPATAETPRPTAAPDAYADST
jgi:alpha-1,6-mannosyltransferase